jgi:mRNA interferase MazF
VTPLRPRPSPSWVPGPGDLIWIDFDPQSGHEQRGRRPALVLSPLPYNRKTGLALVCPITSQQNGYPFEVPLPPGLRIGGCVLADHLKNLDWKARRAEYSEPAPNSVVERVKGLIEALLELRT